MASRTLQIRYTGDPRGVLGAVRQIESVHAGLGTKLRNIGQSMSRIGSRLTLGVTLPIIAAGKKTFEALQRIETINAQTEAALESTGGAAGVTADHIQDLAGEIERLTSVEAETVQEGENLLLTFTKIRNEAGKGNDVFDQATRIITDMSVALGQDMKSSAIQVGKALQDPILGMTALRRVGVSFSEDQVEFVQRLVDSGKQLEAQKFILAELNTEFGKSAEALGKTDTGKLTIAMHELGAAAEGVMATAMPVIRDVAAGIADWAKGFQQASPETKKLVAQVAALAAVAGPALFVVGKLVSTIGVLLSPLGAVALGLVAVGDAALTFYKNAKLAGDAARDLGNAMAEGLRDQPATFQKAAGVVKEYAGEIDKLRGKMDEINVSAGEFRGPMDIWNKFKDVVAQTIPGLTSIQEAITNTTHALRDELMAAMRGVSVEGEGVRGNMLLARIAAEDWTGALELLDMWLDAATASAKAQQRGLKELTTEYDRNMAASERAAEAAREEARERRQAAREAKVHANNLNELEAELRGLPDRKKIDLELDTSQAMAALRAFMEAARGLEGLGGRVVFP